SGKIVANLTANPADLDVAKVIKGHVVDINGAPVAGARIEPFGCKDGQNRWWGTITEISEKDTYTNAKGEFVLLLKKPDLQVDLKVTARKCAPQLVALVTPGDADHEIGLTPGATVTGRLLKDEKPLPGIE